MNEKILFISYQFPPQAGPGVNRSLQFVKYLPDLGYDPIVLTIREADIRKFGATTDETLINKIPKNVKIYRIYDARPSGLIKLLQKIKLYRLFWFIFYPLFWEYSALWPFISYFKARRLVKTYDIKLVYTTSGPFSSMILGYLLQKQLRLKWVADLRDPFTDAYFWSFPSIIHWYLMRFFEKWLFSKPDILLVNTPSVKKLYIERNVLKADKIKVLTNGF